MSAAADALARTVGSLRAEGSALEQLVRPLRSDRWSAPTPAAGWTIAHQVGHLWWTDRVALTAMTDEPAFLDLLRRASANPADMVDEGAARAARAAPAELLEQWQRARERLAAGPADPLVRSPDALALHGHRTSHGDLGPRP